MIHLQLLPLCLFLLFGLEGLCFTIKEKFKCECLHVMNKVITNSLSGYIYGVLE